MSGQPEHDHVSVSFGARNVPYANWYYISLTFIDANGNRSATALHANSSVGARAEIGVKKIGKKVGFGKHTEETVIGFEVVGPTFRKHPDGIVVRIKQDAEALLRRQIFDGQPPTRGLSREEQQCCEFFRQRAGRSFDVMRNEDVPQMSTLQFWNTMPTDDASAGFFLPRGLCEVVETQKQEAV